MKPVINFIFRFLHFTLHSSLFAGLLIVFLAVNSLIAIAQTPPPPNPQLNVKCIVLKQPCKGNDGILVAKDTVTPPPLTFKYVYNSISITHYNVNAISDTIKGIQGCSSVYASNKLYGEDFTNKTGMIPPFNIDTPKISPAICPKTTGTAEITINGGTIPDTVKWFAFINNQPGIYIGTGNPMNLPVGKYIPLVIANGCKTYGYGTDSISAMINISEKSNIKFSINTTDANCTNGTATVSNITSGIAPYTYNWGNGANTSSINNLTAGTYYVTVIDSQGCYTKKNAYITQSIVISIEQTITPASCLQNDGSVISFGSGGTSPYTYIYSNGTTGQTASGLNGGTTINVIATDAKGCTGSGTADIFRNTPITVTYSTTQSSCTAATGSATLNINGGTIPYTVDWNTYPVQNGETINNMSSGTYYFKVTDAKGCVQTGTVYIPPQSTISASLSSVNAVCPSDTGAVYVSVYGTNPPYTYLWNTGDTKQSISNLPAGEYNCTITDNVGCSVIKYTNVNITSPVSIGLTSTPASCIYASDGSIFANAYGGTPQYTFIWSNGQTGNNATGLAAGYYDVYVIDDNGCTQDNHTVVGFNKNNDSCYCTIKGKVYVDQNKNCKYDIGEPGVQNIMMYCEGFGYTFTDINGNYSFIVPTGKYTLSEEVLNTYPLESCQSNAINVNDTAISGCTDTVNFANIINSLHDISIITTDINNAIPGYQYTQGLIVKNDGTNTESNIQIGYKHDGQLQYVNTCPKVLSQLNPINQPYWYSITKGFDTLSPGQATELLTSYNVPANIPLGTTVNFSDTAAYTPPLSNWLNDYSPWNNVNNFSTSIIGSFDPNFIEVLPIGKGPEGLILNSDSVLTYIIHFQNTGSYYAENIVIIDTLDKNLNLKTLNPGYSNYNFVAAMSESGVLKFTFKNINLAWESRNEITSRGLVTYSIKLKPNLSVGTKIYNKASVYFDYNSPLPTKSCLNTIGINLDIKESQQIQSDHVYPNPARTELYIDQRNVYNIRSVYIYDLTGRVLHNEIAVSNTIQKISVSGLATGIYFLELLKANGEKTTFKFVKD